MSSFLQERSVVRPRSTIRPVIIGALTCGALMVTADAAKAYHVMADGTMCPHAKGELQPGESKAAPTIERAARSAPLGGTQSATRSAPAARPAAKPAVKAPVQRPAVQAQAQRPAASQAQAQRPAAATQPAVSQARVSVPAQRRAQVALPAQRQSPVAKSKAAGSDRRATTQPVSRPVVAPVVMPDVTTDSRSAGERPTATAVTASPTDSGGAVSTVALAMLFGMCAILIAGVIALRRRIVGVKRAEPAPTLVEAVDAAIEAELQQIIAETRARALPAPAALDEEGQDDRELSETR